MTTLTIDIPDDQVTEVITHLKKFGLTVRASKLAVLGNFTKESYTKHFLERPGKDEISYLLGSLNNAMRLSRGLDEFKGL